MRNEVSRACLATSVALVVLLCSCTPAEAQGRASLREFDTTGLLIDADKILAGGPPKDGIPALVDPKTIPVGQADFLKADDRVVGLEIGDEARAYPLNILTWHEIANDTLGGVPVAIIYCPLCDSVSVVDRRVSDKTLTFGVSGLLYNSNVLMYDRTDNALWSQEGMQAVSGPHAGTPLTHLPWEITTFARWKAQHPDSTVLSTRTGHRRDYARNPYTGYFATDRLMFPVDHKDDRLPAKERVVGVIVGESARAYPLSVIAAAPNKTVRDTLAGESIEITADESGMVKIVDAPESARTIHTFWFAWAAFHPHSDIYGSHGSHAAPAGTAPAASDGRGP